MKFIASILLISGAFLLSCGPDEEREEARDEAKKSADEIIQQIEDEDKRAQELERRSGRIIEGGEEILRENEKLTEKIESDGPDAHIEEIEQQLERINLLDEEARKVLTGLEDLNKNRHERHRQKINEIIDSLEEKEVLLNDHLE